jgi:type IV secretion system protein VirB9
MRVAVTAGSITLAFAIASCAAKTPPPPPPLTLVTNDAASPEPSPAPLTGAQILAQQPSEVRQAFKEHTDKGEWPTYDGGRYVLYPYGGGADPTVNCAPLRTTDVQLQPGETITDVASGDSERWMVIPAASGDPQNPTPHLALKPQTASISTNLTIYTTKHIYHLMLRSRPGHEMQEVRFYYPDELLAAMRDTDKAANEQKADPPSDGAVSSLKSLDPGAMNFAYAVAGTKVPWKPVRAFDDGKHVYIQMPQRMESSESPVLMVASNGGNQMVNYRVKGDFYVIDRLFSEAVLVSGVGRNQDRVTIDYTGDPR